MNALRTLMLIAALATTMLGQEIVGPEEASTSQPVWLSLDLPEGFTGKFDAHLLDTDPTHVAPGAAMFFSLVGGSFRIVAAVVDDAGEIEFVEHTIFVKGTGPPSPDQITKPNVLKWLQEVSAEERNESVVNAITEKEMTRQEAISQTFLNIGKAGPAIGSIPGLDQLLSTALVSVLGDSATDWQPFADSIDRALNALKAKKPTAVEYGEAFLVIGEALQ